MIRMVRKGYADTSAILAELDAHPEVWNTYPYRIAPAGSPHRDMSDIWVRYNPIENHRGDMAEFNGPHVADWYKEAAVLPEVRRMCMQIARDFKAVSLGAVLITKLPPGKQCYPHIDGGWHARYYEKFALQIKGNLDQQFSVATDSLRTESGDLFEFDNSKLHWVVNPSNEERITMIVCIRRE